MLMVSCDVDDHGRLLTAIPDSFEEAAARAIELAAGKS